MTSVSDLDIGHDYEGDAGSSTEHLTTSSLDADLDTVQAKINELLAALASVIRDDDTLVDEIVKPRNLDDTLYNLMGGDEDLYRLECVELVADSNIASLSGEQSIDGVTSSTSRVLLTAQTDASENGIWVTAAGAWARGSDMAAAASLDGLYLIHATDGGNYAGTRWQIDATAAALTVGTDNLTVTQTGPAAIDRKRYNRQAIAYAASITPDLTDGDYVVVGSLTGDITINNPTNPVPGQEWVIRFTQDATGGRHITWGAKYLEDEEVPCNTAPNSRTIYTWVYDGTADNHILKSVVPDTRSMAVKDSIAYAASVTPNLTKGNRFVVGPLTGNVTVNNPTGATTHHGLEIVVELEQDATGSRTVTWGAKYKVATAIDSTASKRTIWTFIYDPDDDEWVEKCCVTGVPA